QRRNVFKSVFLHGINEYTKKYRDKEITGVWCCRRNSNKRHPLAVYPTAPNHCQKELYPTHLSIPDLIQEYPRYRRYISERYNFRSWLHLFLSYFPSRYTRYAYT